MPAFYANEFAATVPDELLDRSINVFTLTVDGPSELSVVVTRDALRAGEDLAGYIDRQLATLQERLAQLRIRRREPSVVGGVAAERLEITWQTREGAITQRQLAAVSPRGPVMTFSATFRGAPAEPHVSTFEAFIASVRFYDPQGPG
jgi:hypothetical protein